MLNGYLLIRKKIRTFDRNIITNQILYMKKLLLSLVSLLMLTALPASAETFKAFLDGLAKGTSATYTGSLVCSYRPASQSGRFYVQDVEGTAGIMIQGTTDIADITTGTLFENPTITRPTYGAALSISGYTVKGTQTITPIVTTLDKINDYQYMLITVNNVTFENSGHLFTETSEGPLEENVTSGSAQGIVTFMSGSKLIGTVIPVSANVTGVSMGGGKLSMRTPADLSTIEGAGAKDIDLKRFLSTLEYGADKAQMFNGEITVTWVEPGDGYVVYQDDSYGAMYRTGIRGLKAGDKIKNVTIANVIGTAARDHNYSILGYTLVSSDNTVEPIDIEIDELISNGAVAYMMVRLKDAEIDHSSSPVFAANTSYPLLMDGVRYEKAAVSAKCCNELVGEAIPDKATLTGIAFYGYTICPTTPAGLQGEGGQTAAIKEYPSIAAYKAASGLHPLAKITGNTQVIYSEMKDNGTGTFVLQDATGGMLIEGQGITIPGIAQGAELKDVVINRTEQGKYLLSRYDGQVATLVSSDNDFAPRVITIGGFNSDTRTALDYTLVQYQDVKFQITTQDVFSKSEVATVLNTDGQPAVVYPYDAAMGQMIPTISVNVTGVAFYNSELDQYQVRPRSMSDITAADPDAVPVIMLDPITLRLRAVPGEEAQGTVKVTMMRATAPVTITRKETDATQAITPSLTSIEPTTDPVTVSFTFVPTTPDIYVETFLFNTEGMVAPVTFAVTGDATSGVSIIAADADGRFRAYDLQGRRVLDTTDAAELRSLPRGLYIVNGAKIVIR